MLVISDSIGKRLLRSSHFQIHAVSGYSAWQCLHDICLGELDQYLVGVSTVTLLVGVNDIPLTTPHNLVSILISCAQALVARKRDLVVHICGIIPRPQTGELYQTAIKSTNKLLESACKAAGFSFSPVFKPFLKGGKIRPEYFTRDELHPSFKGLKALFNTLCSIAHKKVTPKHTFVSFCGKTNPLSNFYPCTIVYKSRISQHIEQCYQIEKAIFCKDALRQMALSKLSNPVECKKLGGKIVTDRNWDLYKAGCMLDILEVKVDSAQYRQALLQYPSAIFLENTSNDMWAVGSSNQGKNTLGCLHILIRCKILLGRPKGPTE